MSKRLLTAAFAVCLFGLIVGAKWCTFDRFGSPMPDWDQWDAEAAELLIPWFEHDHFAQHLFHPHNEHRVVLTKLQNLALGLVNGQWDSRVEAATNAMLHAALAVAFWICACRWVPAAGDRRQVTGDRGKENGPSPVPCLPSPVPCLLFLLNAVLFGLPLAWQNILGGFHSQQYWLLALSFTAIVLLPSARSGSARWWFGAAAAVLALGSMGSGFLAAAVVMVVVIWRAIRGETAWRTTAPTLTLCAVVVVVGWFTRVEVPWHQDLKARTAHDFVFSIIHSMEWPLRDADWAALVMWLPWLLVAWGVLAGVRRQPSFAASRAAGAAAADKHAPQIIVALGGWVLVQMFATAYARGVGADYPASRYMDTLAFGAAVNGAAVAWLVTTTRAHRRAHKAAGELFSLWTLVPPLATLAWIATLGFGLYEVTARNLRWELPDAKKYYVKAEGHVRRYLGSNDPKQLAYPDIPFPSAEGLIERLSHPTLRALMPVPIRAPLPLAASAAPPIFQENDARGADVDHPPRSGLSSRTPPLDFTKTWGSFAEGAGGAATGTWRSMPIQPTVGGWLKFETAGQVGDPNDGVLLELHDARTDALLTRIRPDRVPGDTWRAAYVRSPRQPFIVVAVDQHAARWLAFSGPVEMGPLSYWAWRATRQGLTLVWFSSFASIALAIVAIRSRRTAAAASEVQSGARQAPTA